MENFLAVISRLSKIKENSAKTPYFSVVVIKEFESLLDSKLQPIQAKFDDLVKQMNDNYTDLYYGMKLERFKILTLHSFQRELSLHFINFY